MHHGHRLTRKHLAENLEEQGRTIERLSAYSVLLMRVYAIEVMPTDRSTWFQRGEEIGEEFDSIQDAAGLTNTEKEWILRLYQQADEVLGK